MQWLLKAILLLHLVAYHVLRQMPGPQWTTLFRLWYSPRHLMLLVAGAEHGMVPTPSLGAVDTASLPAAASGAKLRLSEKRPASLPADAL